LNQWATTEQFFARMGQVKNGLFDCFNKDLDLYKLLISFQKFLIEILSPFFSL